MIDQNRDGFIDSDDLKDMLSSLGERGSCFERVVGLTEVSLWNVSMQDRNQTSRLLSP